MGREGFEPPVFLMSRIYSPLPSNHSAHLPRKSFDETFTHLGTYKTSTKSLNAFCLKTLPTRMTCTCKSHRLSSSKDFRDWRDLNPRPSRWQRVELTNCSTAPDKRSKLCWERSNTSGTHNGCVLPYYTNSHYLCNSDYGFSSLLAFSRHITLSICKSFSSYSQDERNWTSDLIVPGDAL